MTTSTTITWTVTAMDCYPQADGETDVVFTVHWTCSGQQTASGKTYTGSVYSTCSVPAPTGSAFTPYNQLTETQVLGWIWANGVDKSATASAAPVAANLLHGELAINTNDGRLFYKDSSGVVQTIAWKTTPVSAGGSGATSQTAYAVLCGGTTSTGPYQSIASVGTAGQVLTSNGAGALPTFQAASGFPAGTSTTSRT